MAAVSNVQTTLDHAVSLDAVPLDGFPVPSTERLPFQQVGERGRERLRELLHAWLSPLSDLVAAGIAIALAFLSADRMSLTAMMLLAVAWPVLLWREGAYASNPVSLHRGAGAREVFRAATVLCAAFLVGSVLEWLPGRPDQLLLYVGLAAATTVAVHVLVDRLPSASGVATSSRLVIAGEPDQVRRAVAEVGRSKRHASQVAAVCLTTNTSIDFDVPVRIGRDRVMATVDEFDADAVLVLPNDDLDPRSVQRLGWELEAMATELYLATPLLDVASTRTALVPVSGLRLVQVRAAARRGPAMWAKEICERLVAGLALVLLFPVLATLALLVRHDSPGPSIFRQERVGHRGRLFTMYKFRTMDTDAETALESLREHNETDGILFKVRLDPRVTRVGRVLRKFSLDELPQLVNVALGQMSLVGPRPALPEEVRKYDNDTGRRLAVKPGITGLWQVSGRSDLCWEESVRLDLAYVDNWSLRLDLQIASRTLAAVLRHEGAY